MNNMEDLYQMTKGNKSSFTEEELTIISDAKETNMVDPDLLDYYLRRNSRTILWNDDIDDCLVGLYQSILRWNKEDMGKPAAERQPIKVFINTDGGDVASVYTIIDLLVMSKTPVITIGLGKVYSAGALLFLAGHKRYLLPHAQVLIHDGYSGMENSIGKMIDNLESLKDLKNQMRDYILSRTTIKQEEYEKNYRNDWWILADDAVNKYGIADKIITDIDELL